jgi:hypothetical protein
MGEGEGTDGKPPWHRQVNDWLGNPLLVAVASSALIYLIIPQLTRGWQNHEKVLEVKTNLVGDMSDAVAKAVMSGRFVGSGLISRATDNPHATQQAFNDAFQSWATNSAVIGSQLAAYFPDSKLVRRWRSYSTVVSDFLQLSVGGQPRDRVEQLLDIHNYFPHLHRGDRDWWKALLERNNEPTFQQDYAELSKIILLERDNFVQRVLDSHASGF